MSGKSLRIFVTGNSPRSIKKITEFNWSGHAFYGTRDQLKQILERPESEGTGIYFLLSDTNTDVVQMYVGETENFSRRIRNHNHRKDWWTHFIVFQSEGSSLNKARVLYLEYVFWKKANESTQIELRNEQVPKEPILSEEDVADLKIFKENILYILEAMNLGYFTHSGTNIVHNDSVESEYTITLPKSDYKAYMEKVGDLYILKAGSYLRKVPVNSFEKSNKGYFRKWSKITNSELVENINEKVCKLIKDLEFTSPSAAAAIVKGRSINGAEEWKNTESGLSINEELQEKITIEPEAA